MLDLAAPPGTRLDYIGERVHVLFSMKDEPLAQQWYRQVRRIFLKQFNV